MRLRENNLFVEEYRYVRIPPPIIAEGLQEKLLDIANGLEAKLRQKLRNIEVLPEGIDRHGTITELWLKFESIDVAIAIEHSMLRISQPAVLPLS